MARTDRPWWYRASPYVGALGGVLTGAFVQTVGVAPNYGLLTDLYLGRSIETLFATQPLLGYALFVGGGATLGWIFRALERRYD